MVRTVRFARHTTATSFKGIARPLDHNVREGAICEGARKRSDYAAATKRTMFVVLMVSRARWLLETRTLMMASTGT